MLTHARALLSLCMLLSLPFLAQAQLSKGMQTATQNGDLELQFFDGNTFFSALYGINRGKMVSDRIMVGGGLSGTVFSSGSTFFGAGVSPFARLYLNPQDPKINAFVGLEAQFGTAFGDGGSGSDLSAFPHVGANLFLQSDVSARGRAGVQLPFDEGVSSPFTIIFDLEPFFTADSWSARKGQTFSLSAGSIIFQDPTIALSFVDGASRIGLNTVFAYMLNDRFALGIDLFYQNANDVVTSTNIEGLVRYYLTQAHTSWFVQAQAGPTFTRIDNLFPNPNGDSFSSFNLFFGGGLNKFLTSNIAVDIQLGVDIVSGDDLIGSATSIAGSVGMQYTFGQE